MQFNVITIFPEMFECVFDSGVVSQGIKSGQLKISIHDLRDFTTDKHRQVDDRPFGGGPGMVLKPEPLFRAIDQLILISDVKPYVIYLSPKGKTFKQEKAEQLSKLENIIIICGRYEGVDQRVCDNIVDEEVSIGDYILSGGEIPAMVIIDSVSRLVPGVIKNEEFNKSESFSDPNDRTKIDYPQYTRPEDYKGMKVPKVLLSGDHKEIKKWRESKTNFQKKGKIESL